MPAIVDHDSLDSQGPHDLDQARNRDGATRGSVTPTGLARVVTIGSMRALLVARCAMEHQQYQTSTFVAGGFSRLGVVLGAAALSASAAGNAARQARTRRSATRGGVRATQVSSTYRRRASTWTPVNVCPRSTSPASHALTRRTCHTIVMADNTQQLHAITTVWAEMLFVTWAWTYCPAHPRLQNLGFLSNEFIQRADCAGLRCASPMAQLAQ